MELATEPAKTQPVHVLRAAVIASANECAARARMEMNPDDPSSNPYHPDDWLTLGSIHMLRVERWHAELDDLKHDDTKYKRRLAQIQELDPQYTHHESVLQ